jgi:hypothetical protein
LRRFAARQRGVCPVELMDAEDPLFILYTSGSTGKPKGVLHTTGGYLTYAAYTHRLVFGLRPDDIHFCAADVGWITGHSYIVYGPFANGVTTVLFESTPLYPDAGRYWQVVDDLQATIFYLLHSAHGDPRDRPRGAGHTPHSRRIHAPPRLGCLTTSPLAPSTGRPSKGRGGGVGVGGRGQREELVCRITQIHRVNRVRSWCITCGGRGRSGWRGF